MSQLTEKIYELVAEAMKLKGENEQLRERIKFLEKQNFELLKLSTMRTYEPVQPNYIPVSPWKMNEPAKNVCSVCGMNFDGKAWGYVCTNSKCPSAITSSK